MMPTSTAKRLNTDSNGISKRLLYALKLENNKDCYYRIRNDITRIAKKHLSIHSTYSIQRNAIKAVEAEIKDKYPDMFGGEAGAKALKLVNFYLIQRHSERRMGHSKKQDKSDNPETKAEPSQAPQNSQLIPLRERMAQNLAFYSSQPSSRVTFKITQPPIQGPSTPRMPNFDPCAPTSNTNVGSTVQDCSATWHQTPRLLTESQATKIRDVSKQLCASPTRHHSQGSTEEYQPTSLMDRTPNDQINAVYRFLHSCIPSMKHFLERFISSGCYSEECLLGISQWKPERILYYLEQLPPHPDGSPILLVEKLTLLEQFQKYFS